MRAASRRRACAYCGTGIGIGRAVQINETAAAFAGVAMGLNGLVTALWAPALVPVVLRVLN